MAEEADWGWGAWNMAGRVEKQGGDAVGGNGFCSGVAFSPFSPQPVSLLRLALVRSLVQV